MSVLTLRELTEPWLVLRGRLAPPGAAGDQVHVLVDEQVIDLFDAGSRAALEVFERPLTWSQAVDALQRLGGGEEDVRELADGAVVLAVLPGDDAALTRQLASWRVIVTATAAADSPDGTMTLDIGGGRGVRISSASAVAIAAAVDRQPLGAGVPLAASRLGIPAVDVWAALFADLPSLLNAGAAFVTTAG